MIKFQNNVFKLDTKNTSYIFNVSSFGHLLSQYYGKYIFDHDNYDFLLDKYAYSAGTCTVYDDQKDYSYCLDLKGLEISSVGKGDYKEPSILIKVDNNYILDLKYVSHIINKQITPLTQLADIHGEMEELIITLVDNVKNIKVDLKYIVDFENDVIVRNILISNLSWKLIKIFKAASMQLELNNQNFVLQSLYGGWGFEGQVNQIKLDHGIYINDSKTGNSSNRHNPFFLLKENNATNSHGSVYGFNLIYSGNHQELVEHSSFDKVRIQLGINPFCFEYHLRPNETFETPYAIMTYSDKGINGMSQNMHDFIRQRVLKINHKNQYPSILINNWEATYMNFTQSKIKAIINSAKKFGIEMFVLDDGWFSNRIDDFRGLGDYDVNKKKLPIGLDGLAKYVNKKGMKFGLWFEPEMVNQDSKLYRLHPDWAIKSDDYQPSLGRHQLVLDLTKKEVQDYIIENVNNILNHANIKYVKWDMNRHISDVATSNFEIGEFYHRYILGLYRVLDNIINNHPDVYFEGCASGGNRFDLGVLTYFDSIWSSDDTDAFERLNIQNGLSLAYPLKTISNHLSACPSHSVLRNTPFETRFNVACFGAFGYELDLSTLLPYEEKMVIEQVKFYKSHRALICDGDFYRFKDIKNDNYCLWMVVSKDKKEAILGYYNGLQKINPPIDQIKLDGLIDEWQYEIKVRRQVHPLATFGGLINMVLPIRVNERGWLVQQIGKRKTMNGEKESYVIYGSDLNNGALKLKQQWMGTGFNDDVRALGDFGSRIYYIKKLEDK